jgi:hypothetical protein
MPRRFVLLLTTTLTALIFAFGSADAQTAAGPHTGAVKRTKTATHHHGRTDARRHGRRKHRRRRLCATAQRRRAHARLCRTHRRRRTHQHRRTHRPRRPLAVIADGGLAVVGTQAYSAEIAWRAVPGSATAEVDVNGQPLDRFDASGPGHYELQQLWPSTTFPVAVRVRDAAGDVLRQFTVQVTTAPRTTAVPRFYGPSAFINAPVGSAPMLAARSSAIVSEAIVPYQAHANLANDDDWGIPITVAEPQSPSYRVRCLYFGCDRIYGATNIPAGADPSRGSDGHLVVLQPDGNELDMWIGSRDSSGWSAGSRSVESAAGPATDGGTDAAHFALAAGVIRPEEIAQGHIDHALAITTPDTRQGYAACPAGHTDGKHASPDALPIGAHVQLDPSINVAALNIPAWQKVIATALQTYGAYVVDTGGSLSMYAESNLGRSYNAWAKASVPADSPGLADLPWGSMRVLSMTQCGS